MFSFHLDVFFFQGNPHLVNTLSKLYSPLIGREIDPMLEITVSVGAFGILFSAIQGLVNPGEEVGPG